MRWWPDVLAGIGIGVAWCVLGTIAALLVGRLIRNGTSPADAEPELPEELAGRTYAARTGGGLAWETDTYAEPERTDEELRAYVSIGGADGPNAPERDTVDMPMNLVVHPPIRGEELQAVVAYGGPQAVPLGSPLPRLLSADGRELAVGKRQGYGWSFDLTHLPAEERPAACSGFVRYPRWKP
jgi:hypothetical protein